MNKMERNDSKHLNKMFKENSKLFIPLSLLSLIVLFSLTLLFFVGCSEQPDSISLRYEYDENSRLKCKFLPNGRKIEYTYNEQGQLTKIAAPDETVTFGYDASGNMVWMKDNAGKTKYRYDAFDRLVDVVSKHSPEKRVHYEYNPWGQVSSLTIFDAKGSSEYKVNYTYDILGRLTSVDDGSGHITYRYSPKKGQIIRRLPNGVETTFSFSPVGELTSISHQTSSNQLIANYQYKYSANGRLTEASLRKPQQVKRFEFDWDKAGRLTKMKLPDGDIIEYRYDRYGRLNRVFSRDKIFHQYDYDKYGRMIKDSGAKFQYDSAGNLLEKSIRGDTFKFRYNARNRMTLARTPNSITKYQYDGLGNLVKMKRRDRTRYFLPNPLNPFGSPLAEFDKSGKLTKKYLFGYSVLGQRDSSGRTNYFLENGLTQNRTIVDENGKISGAKGFFSPAISEAQTFSRTRSFIQSQLSLEGQPISKSLEKDYLWAEDLVRKIGAPSLEFAPTSKVYQNRNMNMYLNATQLEPPFTDSPLSAEEVRQKNNMVKKTPLSELVYGGTKFISMQEADRKLDACPIDPTRIITDEIWADKKERLADFSLGQWAEGTVPFYIYPGGENVRTGLGFVPYVNIAAGVYMAGESFLTGDLVGGTKSGVGTALNMAKLLGKSTKALTRASSAMTLINIATFPFWKAKSWRYEHAAQLASRIWDDVELRTRGDRRIIRVKNTRGGYHNDITVGRLMSVVYDLEQDPHKVGRRGQFWRDFYTFLPSHAHLFLRRKGSVYNKLADTMIANYGGKERFQSLLDWITSNPNMSDKQFERGYSNWKKGGELPAIKDQGSLMNPQELLPKGVRFDQAADFPEGIGNIIGAVYDKSKQRLILVGDGNIYIPAFRAEDLAIALLCAKKGIDPTFSLDPADPRNPRGEWLKAVYRPKKYIAGTHFGDVMFRADWLLKQYSFGITIDEKGKLQKRHSRVDEFKSTKEIALEREDYTFEQEQWSRFWIVSDKMLLRRDENGIYFDKAKMRVKTMRMVPTSSGLKDVPTKDDPVANAFAENFTKYYDDIASESPVFEQVKRLAKAVALAKWLKEFNIPVDMSWVAKHAGRKMDKYTARVPALSVKWKKSEKRPFVEGNRMGIQTRTHVLHLFGGVDLSVNPQYRRDDGRTSALTNAVERGLKKNSNVPIFPIQVGDENLIAAVLPVTKEGNRLYKEKPTQERRMGITYKRDEKGRLRRAFDSYGNHAEYTYDSSDKLKKIELSMQNNWNITAERTTDGAYLNMTTPTGHSLKYYYNRKGLLSRFDVDGKRFASYEYNQERKTLNIHYQGYDERVVFDQNNNIRQYKVIRYGEDGTYAESESIDFEYGPNGVVKMVSGESIGTFEYSYSSGKLASITTSSGDLQFVYGEKDSLKRVQLPGELSVDYSYVGGKLRELKLTRGEHSLKYIYENGLLVRSKNFAGGSTKYEYEGIYPKSVTNPAGLTTKYFYDKGKIKKINLPDGRRITYEYRKKHKEGEKVVVDVTLRGRTPKTPVIRQVERYTDQETAVLLVNKRGSGKYMKFGLRAETPISSDIEKELDIVFGKRLGNRETAFKRLKATLSSVANEERTVIVWTPGEQGNKLSLFLTKYMGVRAVFTENIQKARQNLTKHQPVGGNTSLVLVDATMLKAQIDAISREVEQMRFPFEGIVHSLQDIPKESNIVVVVAENNPKDKVTFLRQLKSAGEAGKLKDKFILLQYCGESKPEVAKKIIDHGAVGVFFYERKISVPAVRLILREADKVIQEKPSMKADEVFRDAIKRVIDGIDSGKPEYAPYKHLKRQLEDMLNNFTLVFCPSGKIKKLVCRRFELIKKPAA